MRTPSRYMPTYNETLTWQSRATGSFVVFLLLIMLGYAIWYNPKIAIILLGIFLAIISISFFSSDATKALDALYRERRGDDIGTFARLFNFRNIDTWIIRATYEEINSELGYKKPFPLRPSDFLEKELNFDVEDLEFILGRIFSRVGISDKNIERNPYYGKVETVGDLVNFCNHQPIEHPNFTKKESNPHAPPSR